MLVDVLLDVNIPKKVKKMNSGRRVLHIGDIDTCMDDEDILRIASKFKCLLVTHDRSLALRATKKHRTLFIKEPIAAEDIIFCLEKNSELLKTASIFCENGIECRDCSTSRSWVHRSGGRVHRGESPLPISTSNSALSFP